MDEDDGIVTVCVLREGQVSEALIIQIMTNDITPPQALGMAALSNLSAT